MNNIITKGSEILSDTFTVNKSSEDLVINEDYSMVVIVTEYLYGKVSGYKVWDTNQTKKFYAKAMYNGIAGTPADTEIEVGSYVVFNRVGDYNSQGIGGFELHTEDAGKSSFVCFIAKSSST